MDTVVLPMKCGSCPLRVESLFGSLTTEQLHRLDFCRSDQVYNKGHLLFTEGTPALGIYCVFQGHLKLYKTGSQGRPQIFGIAAKGSIVGHRALLSDSPHSFTAQTMGVTRICFIPRETFLPLLRENASVGKAFFKRLALDLDEAENRLVDWVEQPVMGRLAKLLLSLQRAYGIPTSGGTRLTLSLTREEMAEMIGTTQETTIRLLSQLRKRGVVRLDNKTITLLNTAPLEDEVQYPGSPTNRTKTGNAHRAKT